MTANDVRPSAALLLPCKSPLTGSARVGKMDPMEKMELSDLERSIHAALACALEREFGRAVVARVVVLFGSRALARERASSDVDLVVALDAPINAYQRRILEQRVR